jgi:hypothetical protein
MDEHNTKEVTMTTMAFTARAFLLRLAVAVAVVLFFALLSRAGGPKCVAGTSYFDVTDTGQPLVWPLGQITYYTDQGNLSPILPNASANALVADAFSQWTAVPTAALTATSGGRLAEDVNGTNVIRSSDGTISMPADIQSSATGTPVGVVYDYDGSVTDALLGSGAGDSSQCFFNAAFGGDDNYGSQGAYQHALLVINGQCALESSQLVEVEYRLVRVIGQVLGLGWSQVNLNVITGNPPATAADYAGFPVMHYTDPVSCVPITTCYPNPYQLAMDDTAAISRLYPITAQNQSSFSGSQVFSAATARIHGSVWFTDSSGTSTQPMQGVNVVARWIDPSTGLPSRQYAASSVSGFLFTGNAGNPITGFNDALGDPFSEWGSGSTTLEGFFDLAGLELPNGGSGQYQLTVEPLDPTWSAGVGPYAPNLVTPSGASAPLTVTVAAGQDAEQDILMAGSAQPVPPWADSETWTAPAPVPPAGNWMGALSGYGDQPYFLLPAQANRTLSVAVMARDENSRPSESKAQPVIGMWAASDPQGTAPPAFTPSPFNTLTFGLTRLDAQVATSANFLIGISDLRGDGRPDYRYSAQVLYADSVSPSRIGVSGGAVTVSGTGFAPGLTASVGSTAATVLAVNAAQMIVAARANGDGPQSITITDPATGGSSTMTNALTYGAAASDNIILLNGHKFAHPGGRAGDLPGNGAGTGLRRRHSGWRRHDRLERHQRGAAFGLQRRLVVHGDDRPEWRRGHLAHARRPGHGNHHGDAGPGRLQSGQVGDRDAQRDRVGFRHWRRARVFLDRAGNHRQRPADGAGSQQWHATKERDRELYRGAGYGHTECGQRGDQLQRLRRRHAVGHAIRGAGAGECLRGPEQCALPELLRQSRAGGAAATAVGGWGRANLDRAGISARRRACHGFLFPAESRARGSGSVSDHGDAAWRRASGRRQRRNQSHEPGHAGDPERKPEQRHD